MIRSSALFSTLRRAQPTPRLIAAFALGIFLYQLVAPASAQWQKAIHAGWPDATFYGNEHRVFARNDDGLLTAAAPFLHWEKVGDNTGGVSGVLLENGDLIFAPWYSYLISYHPNQYGYSGALYRYSHNDRTTSLFALDSVPVSVIVRAGRQTLIAITTPQDPHYYWAASIMRSTDGGRNWHEVDLPGRIKLYWNDNLLKADSTGRALFASPEGIFLSRDSGATWNRIGPAIRTEGGGSVAFLDAFTMAVAGKDSLFVTSDGGVTWQGEIIPVDPGDGWEMTVENMAFVDRERLLVVPTWAHRSPTAWTSLYELNLEDWVWNVSLERKTNDIIVTATTLIASTTDGLYRSEDRGNTWSVIDLDPTFTYWYPESPANGYESFARLTDGEIITTAPVFSSRDNGVTWTGDALTKGVYGRRGPYKELYNGGLMAFSYELAQFVYLPPNQRTWEVITVEEPDPPYPVGHPNLYPNYVGNVAATSDGVWFAWTTHSFRYLRSDDRWIPIEQKLAFNDLVSLDENLYVAGVGNGWRDTSKAWVDPGVYVSTDRGITWSQRSTHVVRHLKNFTNGTLVIATPDGIEVSTDQGRTWVRRLNARPEGKVYVHSLLLIEPSTIIVNSQRPNDTIPGYAVGLYRSDDFGATWREWNDGLETREVVGLGLGFGGRVFAATTKGIHYRELTSSVETAPTSTKHSPFGEAAILFTGNSDEILLRCDLHTSQPVLVQLFDAAGTLHRIITRQMYPSGTHDIALATRGLASGTYVVQLCIEGGECLSRKFAVVR